MDIAGVDRLSALYTAIDAVRRGGTISLSGVYGGMKDPMPIMTLFDKQVQMRMGQCNVRNWTNDILPLVDNPSDPLGVLDLKTHTASLDDAPAMCEKFQKKEDGSASRSCSSRKRSQLMGSSSSSASAPLGSVASCFIELDERTKQLASHSGF